MADNDFFDHTGSDESTVVVRVEREKYLWRAVGENVAMGPRSVPQAVEGWLDSPGHCSNIMNGDFTEMGAALSHNGQYWVQVFAAPRGSRIIANMIAKGLRKRGSALFPYERFISPLSICDENH